MPINTLVIIEHINNHYNIKEKVRQLVSMYGKEVAKLHYNIEYKDSTLDRYYNRLNVLEDAIDTLIKVAQYKGINIHYTIINRYMMYQHNREAAN